MSNILVDVWGCFLVIFFLLLLFKYSMILVEIEMLFWVEEGDIILKCYFEESGRWVNWLREYLKKLYLFESDCIGFNMWNYKDLE